MVQVISPEPPLRAPAVTSAPAPASQAPGQPFLPGDNLPLPWTRHSRAHTSQSRNEAHRQLPTVGDVALRQQLGLAFTSKRSSSKGWNALPQQGACSPSWVKTIIPSRPWPLLMGQLSHALGWEKHWSPPPTKGGTLTPLTCSQCQALFNGPGQEAEEDSQH